MNPVKLVLGFVPFLLFSVLTAWIPVGWAAAAGLVAALAVVAATAGGGIKVLPLVQAVILLVIAVLGFAAGPATVAFLTVYGRGLASSALGLFIVATAARTPFTAQFARAAVPESAWHTPEFLRVIRQISLAWGSVALILGACHLVGAFPRGVGHPSAAAAARRLGVLPVPGPTEPTLPPAGARAAAPPPAPATA